MRNVVLLSVLVVTVMAAPGLASDTTQTEAVFPFFIKTDAKAPDFEFWSSSFEILNASSETANVTVTAITGDLNEHELHAFSVNGFRRASFDSSDFDEEFIGWLRVNSDQPFLLESTLSHYYDLNEGKPTTNIPLPWILKSRIQLKPRPLAKRHITQVRWWEHPRVGTNTGLAIVFSNEDDSARAKGKLVFRGIDGRFVTESEFEIPANGQILGLFTELLPESTTFSALGLARGTVEIEFDQPVAVMAIQTSPTSDGADLEERLNGILSD